MRVLFQGHAFSISNLRTATRNQENIQQLEHDIAILKIDIKEIVKRFEKNLQK